MAIHFVTFRPNIDRNDRGTLDRYEGFMAWAGDDELEEWSANKSFVPGDLAIFYMTRPLASLVGVGVVDSEPYVIEKDRRADFSNQVFCDYRPMWFLEEPVPIKEAVDRQGLEPWWKTTPYQSIRKMPEDVAVALIKEMTRLNPGPPGWLRPWGRTRKGGRPTPPGPGPKPPGPDLDKKWTLKGLHRLEWRQFELLMEVLFARLNRGAQVELTPGSKDKGVDIFIRFPKTGKVEIVQCKRYRPSVKVSSPDMQKFAGALMKFKASKGYFVTTSDFNGFATDYAQGLPIDLINGRELVKMLSQAAKQP